MEPTKNMDHYPKKEDFEKLEKNNYTLDGKDGNGNEVKYVLLSSGDIAMIKEGTGADVERATMIASGQSNKYFSAMMAATTEINGVGIVTEDLAALKMKDYTRIQVTFSEVNF